MDRWVGRVAIVTGASVGIGAAIVKSLALNGMKVVGVARRVEKIQTLAEELKSENPKGELHAIKGDVTSEADIKKIIKWTRENLGGLDVLVNNAGVGVFKKLSELPLADIRRMLDLNVVGLSLFTRDAIQDMKSRGVNDGHIFHINSIGGHEIVNMPGTEMYVASKHAVTVLTEGLRRELRDMGTKIRVTSISPGAVKTEFAVASGLSEEQSEHYFKTKPYLEAEDVSDALVYALSAPPHVQVHEMIILPVGRT